MLVSILHTICHRHTHTVKFFFAQGAETYASELAKQKPSMNLFLLIILFFGISQSSEIKCAGIRFIIANICADCYTNFRDKFYKRADRNPFENGHVPRAPQTLQSGTWYMLQ